MGMASSQARLLSLTSRQHDVELKAQRLQADKLRLANDSDRVYNTYLEALNATKIQTKVYDLAEGDTFKDATLAMIENGSIPKTSAAYVAGEYAAKPLFLEEISTGRLMITPEYARHIGVNADSDTYTGSLDDFLTDVEGLNKKSEPHGIKTETPRYTMVPDTDSVSGFTPIDKSAYVPYSTYHTYTPVANNNDPTFDEEELAPYAKFDDTHKTVGGTAVSAVTSFNAGQTYTISNKNDLNKMLELVNGGANTAGVNFVMTGNVDMSGVNWTGIGDTAANAFKGTFDGNGYKIDNLSGTNGLFAYATGATVKNVDVGISSINGTSHVGGLIGFASDTDIINSKVSKGTTGPGSINATGNQVGGLVGYFSNSGGAATVINNVSSSVDVSSTGNSVGGLIGHYNVSYTHSDPRTDAHFDNAYSVGNVNGNTDVGGLVGHWYSDPDKGLSGGSNKYYTEVSNMYSGGSVSGTTNTGGFVGSLRCYDDYEDGFRFSKIDTTSKITDKGGAGTAGIFIGCNNAVTATTESEFVNSGYATGVNAGMDLVGTSPSGTATIPEGEGKVESFEVAAKIPQVTGESGYYSNIIGVLTKQGTYDPENPDTNIENAVKAFLNNFNDDRADNTKLYYLNNAICSYLNTANPSADQIAFADSLAGDVLAGTTTLSAAYQAGADIGNIKRSKDESGWDPEFHDTKGQLIIPSIATMKQNLISASKMYGQVITSEQADAFFAKYDITSANDKAYLAGVNDTIVKYAKGDGNIGSLIKMVQEGVNKFDKLPDYIDDPEHYNIIVSTSNQAGTVAGSEKYNTKPELAGTDITWEWNMENQEVINGIANYNLLQKGFVIIGDANISADYDGVGMHESSDWLTNVINCGIAQFVTYDHETKSIKGTSVANETSLQEISNKEFLMKAEATYEKDMKKINKKETKADTDLSKLEAERTSIKTEQDSLKKVIQDNVDLTFKLFS